MIFLKCKMRSTVIMRARRHMAYGPSPMGHGHSCAFGYRYCWTSTWNRIWSYNHHSPAPLVAATRLRRIMCNPVSSVSCILRTLFSVSRLPVSVSGSLESCSGILDCLLLGPGNHPIYLPPERSRDLGWPHNHPSNFKPVSRATKVMKIGPKATKNHEKLTVESWEIQFVQKLIFAIPPLPNAWFSNPRHPDSNPKIIRKSNLEIDMKKLCFPVQMYPEICLNGSPKSTKNR